MTRILAVVLGVLLPFLGLAGIGPLQSAQAQQQAAEVDGNTQAVDSQNGNMTLTASYGVNTVYPSDNTPVLINNTAVPFCTLVGFVGAPASAWLEPNGNQPYASQIEVMGPAPSYPGVVTNGYSPVPIWGTVLGTIVVRRPSPAL